MACEVIVKIKDKAKSMTQKTRVYKRIDADFEDSEIDALVARAEKEFGGEALGAKIDVTIKLIKD
jgi:hypothetical protein